MSVQQEVFAALVVVPHREVPIVSVSAGVLKLNDWLSELAFTVTT